MSRYPRVARVELVQSQTDPTNPGGQHTNGPTPVWVVVDGVAYRSSERSLRKAQVLLAEALVLLGVDLEEP